MKKLLSLVLILALAVSMFVACGAPEATEAAEEPAAEKVEVAEKPEEPAEPIVLTMTGLWGETEVLYDTILLAIDLFEEANPGVTIEYEPVPQETYLVQTPTLATAGDLPDIVATNGSMSRLFGETGAMLSLQPYLDADPEWVEKVWPSAFVEHKVDGEPYAMGFDAGTYGFLRFNKTILAEVGYDSIPETMDEFIVLCDALKAAGYTPLALGDSELWPADSINFSAFVNNYVGNAWTEAIFAKTGEAAFTDQVFIDALAGFQNLGTSGYFNDNMMSINHTDSLSLYINQKVAMRGFGDWEDTIISQQAPEIAEISGIGAWPAPANAKATNSVESSSAWGYGIAANIDEEKIPYAVEFISKYMTSDARTKMCIEEKSTFTPFNIGDDAGIDYGTLFPIVADRSEFVQNTATACLNWDAILDASVKEIYQRGLQSLLIGEMTPEELAGEMQAEYEALQ